MYKIAHKGVFIKHEHSQFWDFTDEYAILNTGDDFEYILQLNGIAACISYKQYRKIIKTGRPMHKSCMLESYDS